MESEKVEFEKGLTALSKLVSRADAAAIDSFAPLYAIVLLDLRHRLARTKTDDEIREIKEQMAHLREVITRRIGFVTGMRDRAMVEEFESIGAELPAVEA